MHTISPLGRTSAVVALLAASFGFAAPTADAAERPSVVADDASDTIVGTGGLILPDGVADGIRREVSSCPGCSWRVTSPCVDSGLGNAFDGQTHCRSVTRGCQVGSLRRTWFRPEGGAWRELGLVCVTERPVTVAMLGDRIHDRLEERLPAPQVAHAPASGVVTGIPTAFSAGAQAPVREFDWTILGQRVRVQAVPTWTWAFPDGTSVRTQDPGRLAPDSAVRHTFRRSGPMEVVCSVEWRGEYTVPGLGTFPVSEVIRQRSLTLVSVGEGRALLTS